MAGDKAFAYDDEIGLGGAGRMGGEEADMGRFLGTRYIEDFDTGFGRDVGGVAEKGGGGGCR